MTSSNSRCAHSNSCSAARRCAMLLALREAQVRVKEPSQLTGRSGFPEVSDALPWPLAGSSPEPGWSHASGPGADGSGADGSAEPSTRGSAGGAGSGSGASAAGFGVAGDAAGRPTSAERSGSGSLGAWGTVNLLVTETTRDDLTAPRSRR
ncbi:exported hypothetical protein [Frankia sp. AiPs1]